MNARARVTAAPLGWGRIPLPSGIPVPWRSNSSGAIDSTILLSASADIHFVGNFLRRTGHHRAIAVAGALWMVASLMASSPLLWSDSPLWVSLVGLALAIPTFASICAFVGARNAEHVSSGMQ